MTLVPCQYKNKHYPACLHFNPQTCLRSDGTFSQPFYDACRDALLMDLKMKKAQRQFIRNTVGTLFRPLLKKLFLDCDDLVQELASKC
jgi:hypothetical protein